jgi:hypothetical protein
LRRLWLGVAALVVLLVATFAGQVLLLAMLAHEVTR